MKVGVELLRRSAENRFGMRVLQSGPDPPRALRDVRRLSAIATYFTHLHPAGPPLAT
jgi:hypothetical protein